MGTSVAKVPMKGDGMAPPAPTPVFDAILAAPGFALGIRVTEQAVQELCFLPADSRPINSPGRHSPLLEETLRQLGCWLDNPAHRFSLPLTAQGSAFRQRVWQAIAAIPMGETRSYGQLASYLNSAARAVGQACGDNPHPIIVPCHRVVGSKGQLGGFNHHADGELIDVKRWLLARERGLAR